MVELGFSSTRAGMRSGLSLMVAKGTKAKRRLVDGLKVREQQNHLTGKDARIRSKEVKGGPNYDYIEDCETWERGK